MTDSETATAMFPLGTVLFPTMVLPLHLFEPRYRQLAQDCLSADREFGVCLIERGHEVGGGEARSNFGTIAQIVDAQELDDGRWALATVGTRRIRVLDWLDDDPYPRAHVQDWPDLGSSEDLVDRREGAVQQLRKVLGLLTELGQPAALATTDIDRDPALASYQISALSPIGSYDRQRLLGAPSVGQRLDEVTSLLTDTEVDLQAQLGLS